jgi:hypothetical protein
MFDRWITDIIGKAGEAITTDNKAAWTQAADA